MPVPHISDQPSTNRPSQQVRRGVGRVGVAAVADDKWWLAAGIDTRWAESSRASRSIPDSR